ncbi:MAG: hypothetical protein HYR76_05455 [Ignavibacteria bacterium]|nr:hypothetical protein [Ignavibacteria bacterium]MBI3766067.1 hypothetical protein [Ignavibacteriales bacterium]
MWKTTEGSTGRLIQLCLGYFIFYVITGVSVKYFTGGSDLGYPGMKEIEYLVYSTIGGNLICLAVVFALRWYRMTSNKLIPIAGWKIPQEALYIIPSGICTAVVIPTTTLMYTLPISVMVAMVIMRASVIIISRIVDAVQIHKGILKKKVYREENIAVVFALSAAAVNILWVGKGDFEFVHSFAAMTILGSYIIAYAIRIYIMNYYKNTRAKGVKLDNNGFFAIEQITATVAMVAVGYMLFHSVDWFGSMNTQLVLFHESFANPRPLWHWATFVGMAYGLVAFFSVFIFMFKGRTATFAGLVNRLTSLVAGTAATIVSYYLFNGRFPKVQDWVSLVFILIAVGFLSLAEKKRTTELAMTNTHESLMGTRDLVAVPEKS